MKLLMHTCCAPCSVYCIDELRSENIEPTVYWFNPNIHPYMEYKARRDTLKEYTKLIGVQAIFEENYGLREFCKNVVDDLENRCVKYCYKVRLEQTAKYAKENGYDTFSTTLLISPYQNHEALKQIGEEMAQKYDITFLYRDFRPGFREGQVKARELGLYMQKYCGCVFSEEMRYNNHNTTKPSIPNGYEMPRKSRMQVKKIENKEDYIKVLKEFYSDFEPLVKKAFDEMEKKAPEVTGDKCPNCGSDLVIRTSRYGKFTACSNYPTCKYIKQEEKKIEEDKKKQQPAKPKKNLKYRKPLETYEFEYDETEDGNEEEEE